MVKKMSKRWIVAADENLRILSKRSNEVRMLLRKRDKLGQYNLTEQKRIMAAIKRAKKIVADVGFM